MDVAEEWRGATCKRMQCLESIDINAVQSRGKHPCSEYLLLPISDSLQNSHYMVLFRNFQTQDCTLTRALRRLRLKDRDFEVNLGYLVKFCQKQKLK